MQRGFEHHHKWPIETVPKLLEGVLEHQFFLHNLCPPLGYYLPSFTAIAVPYIKALVLRGFVVFERLMAVAARRHRSWIGWQIVTGFVLRLSYHR